MASKASGLWAVGLAVALALQCAAAADHVVGGSTGWTIPPSASFYQTWAKNQTFKAGDKLVFNFQTGNHDVLRVSKANYGSCGTSNALETHNTGPTTITLTKSGTYYYVCGVPGHCSAGQKVSLTVGSGTAAAPSAPPSSSPAPSAGGTGPAASVPGPAPSKTGGAPSPAGSSATPSASGPSSTPSENPPSAGSRASLGSLLVVLSMAVSLFL